MKNEWFVGISCSIIATLIYSLGENIIKISFLNSLLQIKFIFELWQILLILIVSICIFYLIRHIFFDRKFLNYKSDHWSDINWVWDWKKDPTSKRYKISNLNMLCLNCSSGIFTVAHVYSEEYKCIKCNYSRLIRQFPKPFSSQIENEIFNEIRKRYSSETKYIDNN